MEPSDQEPTSFSPNYVYEAIRKKKIVDAVRGRQEDAQEFLGFLLDGIHEELCLNHPQQTTQNDDWVQVGKKNKSVIARRTESTETSISRLFGGRFRSIVRVPGSKDSVTVEPFFTLQLDITVLVANAGQGGKINQGCPL